MSDGTTNTMEAGTTQAIDQIEEIDVTADLFGDDGGSNNGGPATTEDLDTLPTPSPDVADQLAASAAEGVEWREEAAQEEAAQAANDPTSDDDVEGRDLPPPKPGDDPAGMLPRSSLNPRPASPRPSPTGSTLPPPLPPPNIPVSPKSTRPTRRFRS